MFARREFKKRRRAFVVADAIIGVALIGLIVTMSLTGMIGHERAVDVAHWQQAALLAADGQLQRLRAGAEFDSLPPAGVVPEPIELETTHMPATGQWEGFTLMTVTAHAITPSGRPVRAEIRGYIPARSQP